jgi:hypothetical protein
MPILLGGLGGYFATWIYWQYCGCYLEWVGVMVWFLQRMEAQMCRQSDFFLKTTQLHLVKLVQRRCDVLGGVEIAFMFLFYVNHSLITIVVVHLFLGKLVHYNFTSLNFVLSFWLLHVLPMWLVSLFAL